MAKGKVLITYASKHGATAEIAERIGTIVRESEMEVDVVPVDRVSGLSGYAAVVLGVAIYVGRWRKDAVKFLKKNEEELSGLPFWIFSSGPSGEGNPVELVQGREVPPSLRAILDRIKPRSVTVFHGNLTPEKFSGFERWVIKRVKAPTGDFRDWNMIESWAASITAGMAPGA